MEYTDAAGQISETIVGANRTINRCVHVRRTHVLRQLLLLLLTMMPLAAM